METRSPFPDRGTVGAILASPTYWKKSAVVRDFMGRSREVRNSPKELLDLQADMAQELLDLRQAQRYYEQQRVARSEPRYRVAVAATKRIHHLIRLVADGIAWRTLGYDRARLYVLASKPQTGDLQSIQAEYDVASRHAGNGEIVLLNDLTNWLRYADITRMTSEGPKLMEVKSGRSRSSRQWQKLGQVADFLIRGVREVEGGSERIYDIAVAPVSHAPALAEVMNRAGTHGMARARLSDCIAVDVFSMEAVRADPELLRKRNNPFSPSSSFAADSLEFFHTFTPNIAPYSIFPLSDDQCSDLLTGATWVVTYFSLHRLTSCLKRRGLTAEFPARAAIKEVAGLPLAERKKRRDAMAVKVFKNRRAPGCSVSLADLGRHLYEFLDEGSYAEALYEVFDWVAPRGERWIAAFEDESVLWD